MNLITKKINLRRALFSGAALASMLGGMIFMDSAVAQESFSNKKRRRCYGYTLINRTNRRVDFNINTRKSYLDPGGKRSFRYCFGRIVRHPLVSFDQIIGNGYKIARVRLTPGRNAFDRKGRILILGTGGNNPPANLTQPVPNRRPVK